MGHIRISRLGWLVLLSTASPSLARAQLGIELRPGSLHQRVVSVADSGQSYALYLPPEYRPGGRFPLLVVMDPRGRALLAMRLVQPSAERLGYIAMSSYNTRSDEPGDPNQPAVVAMLTDAQRQLAIDPHRVYFVGFSGTTRIAWPYAFGLRGHVAGVLGFGAGFADGFELPSPPGPGAPVYFGGAGTTDYNYGELRRLEDTLAARGLTARFAYYDGPHAWPPEPVMAEGLTWMELQAMRAGLREPDGPWIDSLLRSEMDSATRLEMGGWLYSAWRRYRAVARDYAGLRDVAVAAARMAALEDSPAVSGVRRALAQEIRREEDYLAQMVEYFREARGSPVPQPLERSLERLAIRELQQRAHQQDDTLGALAARRELERIFVHAGFYEPRDYLAVGQAERTLALLAIAGEIKPAAPILCYHRARALLQLDRKEDAVRELGCWADALGGGVERLEADSTLAALAGYPAYEGLLARLRTTSPVSGP